MKRLTFLSSIMVMLLVSGMISSPAGAATINLVGSWVAGTTHEAEYGGGRVVIFIAHAEFPEAEIALVDDDFAIVGNRRVFHAGPLVKRDLHGLAPLAPDERGGELPQGHGPVAIGSEVVFSG